MNTLRIRRLTILILVTLFAFFQLTAACYELSSTVSAVPVSTEASTFLRREVLAAARGELYDRNGLPLITNRTVYALVFDHFGWTAAKGAAAIRETLTLLREHGISYSDHLPLSKSAPWHYTCDANSADARRMARMLRHYGLEETLPAEEAFLQLTEVCRLPEDCEDEERRAILGVLYDMVIADFSADIPFVIEEDVSAELVAIVSEQQTRFPGLFVQIGYERQYETDYAAHVLGRSGEILAEDAADFAALGYASDAIVGRDGAERAFEHLLRGQDGTRMIEVDEAGHFLSLLEETPARSGSDVYLTLDLRLQQTAEDSLALHIQQLRETGVAAEGGAAVVLRVDTGEVLVLASHPTYTLSSFREDYAALSSDPLSPLFHRAIAGTYAPGSTYKLVTATAALSEGILTPETLLPCEGVYTHFAPQYLYHCWVYRDYGRTHGMLTTAGALQESCNCFFYETGRLLGIDAITRYAAAFGLGERTGLELSGEAAGIVASPKNRTEGWYTGDTLQAAIGQSDNLFTPLQLCSFMATLASGGERYAVHLLHHTVTPDGTVADITTPVPRNTVAFSDEIYDTIREGMLAVTADGTASSVFSDYEIPALGKSGSAQVSSGQANGLFILAAPADAPEIAVAVVIEHGASGNNAARVARDILTAYFGETDPDSTEE